MRCSAKNHTQSRRPWYPGLGGNSDVARVDQAELIFVDIEGDRAGVVGLHETKPV